MQVPFVEHPLTFFDNIPLFSHTNPVNFTHKVKPIGWLYPLPTYFIIALVKLMVVDVLEMMNSPPRSEKDPLPHTLTTTI